MRKNRDYKAEKIAKKKHYDKNRAWLDSLKAMPCEDCGGEFPPECMDFDHVRGRKKFGIATSINGGRDRLAREIAKCDVVCSNCHRIRTRRRREKGR